MVEQPTPLEGAINESEVRQRVAVSCAACKVPERAGRIDLAGHRRFAARPGGAFWSAWRGRGPVRPSVPFLPTASRAEQEGTAVHEVCHVVAEGRFEPSQGLGPRWRPLMPRCSYAEARRCHTVYRAVPLAGRPPAASGSVAFGPV